MCSDDWQRFATLGGASALLHPPRARIPRQEADLQPNLPAANLLRKMRTCCIYKFNGCTWKGRVSELGVHHRECRYADDKVSTAPSALPHQLAPRSPA